jgi:hypothetical protein
MSNFENLKLHVGEAREALRSVDGPPLPEDSSNPYATLYYPLLFLTETVEATLRAVTKRSYEETRPEIEAAEKWLAEAEAVVRAHQQGE